MRLTATGIAMLVLFTVSATAQIKSVETTTTVDSSSGKSVTTYSTSIKTEEDITPRRNMIVVNPLKFFLFYNISYYHSLNNSIVLGGGIQTPTLADVTGFGVNAEMRFHPSGKALRGFYIAPNLSYNALSGTRPGAGSRTAFSLGALLGWQWFPGDEFAMGIGIGADYYFDPSSSAGYETDFLVPFSGTVPAFRFDIGYAW